MTPDEGITARVDLTIRDCAPGDLPALEHDLPSHGAELHARFLHRQRAGEATYLVAWSGPRPVGSGVIGWLGFPSAESRARLPGIPVIRNLAVPPPWRNRGVATALIRAAERRILERGQAQVGIAVGLDNPDAARLYRRLGYVDTWLREVSRYDALDEAGGSHRFEEHNRLLRKRL